MTIHKGDRILYTAVALPEYPFDNNGELCSEPYPGWKLIAAPERKCEYSKCLVRVPTGERRGIVIGKTHRAIGIYSPEYIGGSWVSGDWDEASLDIHERIPLWMVVEDGGTDRYYKPVLVHEDDIQPDPIMES